MADMEHRMLHPTVGGNMSDPSERPWSRPISWPERVLGPRDATDMLSRAYLHSVAEEGKAYLRRDYKKFHSEIDCQRTIRLLIERISMDGVWKSAT